MRRRDSLAAAATIPALESGYKGERVVFLALTDYPILNAECLIGSDMPRKVGLKVDYQALDWGTMISRRNNRDTIDKDGWRAFCTAWEALNLVDPGSHYPIFGTGLKGWFGWMDSPRLEELRTAWSKPRTLRHRDDEPPHYDSREVWKTA